MRILFLSPSYAPKLGGVEIHAQRVAEILAAQGHEVVVLTTSHAPHLPSKEVLSGVKVVRAPFFASNKKLGMWRWMATQFREIITADIVHVHDVMWWLAPFLPFLFWKPIHLTHHGWEGQFPVPTKNKLQRWLWARSARSLTHIGAWIQEFYWEKPDLILYGGSDDVDLPKSVSDSHPIVFLGRLESENDVSLYIHAAKIIKKKLPHQQFLFVGDGSLRAEAEKVGKVTGMVPDPAQYLQNARIVWSASYLSMLQAQRAGKVVGAMYSHDLKKRYLETYPGRSAMILHFDPQKFSELCIDMLQNVSERKKKQQVAYAWASQQTWKKVAEQYLRLW